ncbi:TPA: hypothetical protein NJV01_003366 [Escherichia coli]|nr:hypothetical protein [Escherichia coli]HCG2937289.1 hypothetical protein [Escherichia coli]HCG3100397.1 hypothetical protein [Escherichia coli]
MKARQKRRERRITAAQPANPTMHHPDPLLSIQQTLQQLQVQRHPDIQPQLQDISVAVTRIERRMDTMETRVVRQGAIAGALSGGVVAAAIALIKARFEGL